MEKIVTMGSTSIPSTQVMAAHAPIVENYLANQDSQQLTPLMLEIITFQLQERALFFDFEIMDTPLS